MLGNKTNSKKTLLIKPKHKPSSETNTSNYMKRYKSQENYLAVAKKFGTLTYSSNKEKENKEFLGPVASPILGNPLNSPTLCKSKEITNNTLKRVSNHLNQRKNSSGPSRKKILSPEAKMPVKITNFIGSSKPSTAKPAAISKIMNDESIQELNTEENCI